MRRYLLIQFMLFLMPCCVNLAYGSSWVFNNPYPESEANENIYYSSFNEQPKTLDPARSYSSNEYLFIAQIYEPLLEYDYYKRPYELIPLTATQLPKIRYLDANGNPVPAGDNSKPAYSVYTIQIKKEFYINLILLWLRRKMALIDIITYQKIIWKSMILASYQILNTPVQGS